MSEIFDKKHAELQTGQTEMSLIQQGAVVSEALTNITNTYRPFWSLCRSDPAEEERPPSHSLSNSKLGLQGLEEEEEEVEGDDEEEEEGSLTEKSHDEAPESPSPVTAGVYEEEEEEEETETAPLAMSYEHTRRYSTPSDTNFYSN